MMKRAALAMLVTMGVAGMGSAACDGDGGGGSGAGTTTSTTTTTTSTGGGGGTGGSGGGGNGGGGTGGAAEGGGGAGGTGGGAPVEGYCVRSCATPADCCPPNLPNCPSNQYPTNFTCDNGICGPPQCAVKADCTNGGQTPQYDCILTNGTHGCAQPCVTDAECTVPATCTGIADDQSKFCKLEQPPFTCTPGESCNGPGVCNAAGDACVCATSAQCSGYYNHCAN